MAKPNPFAAHVAKLSAKADRKALGKAVGALTKARLTKRTAPKPERIDDPARTEARALVADIAKRQRRSPRRLGRYRAYTPTQKPDVSRLGTFRHYMLSVIRKHSDTNAANTEHSACDNPSWAKNKLDFNWAADNGYITFN